MNIKMASELPLQRASSMLEPLCQELHWAAGQLGHLADYPQQSQTAMAAKKRALAAATSAIFRLIRLENPGGGGFDASFLHEPLTLQATLSNKSRLLNSDCCL
jgi:hypothetical protein